MSQQDLAIQVKGLSKVFHLYARPLDMLMEMILPRSNHRELWALRDLSFEVKKGEMVGLIGRNGSGKSTLLRILARVLDKTHGEMTIHGSISAILELGTGFHPEYTGRQNIFMGGMCLGLSKQEIDSKLEWIVDFSELDKFIDQPIRTYSTGMKARLAFSTAICVDPDVLFIDEALSVGDAKFVRKCFDMIGQFRAKGRTIILVSHDLNTVSTFCDKALLLDQGCLIEYGKPREVAKTYCELLYCREEKSADSGADRIQTEEKQGKESLRQGSRDGACLPLASSEAPYELRFGGRKEAEVIDFGIWDQKGNKVTNLVSGEQYRFFLHALFHEDVEDPVFGFLIRDPKGTTLFGLDTAYMNYPVRPHKKGELLEGIVEVTMWLTNGEYFLTAAISCRQEAKVFDVRSDGLLFSVPGHSMVYPYSIVNLQPKVFYNTIADRALNDKQNYKVS